ncbi:MAG: ferritin-like domain-containing protein [Pseudomonadota bacterium]
MTQAVLKHSVSELENRSGIDRKSRETLADRLRLALSNAYQLMINTQIVHWNAQGPLFFSVHKLTESQYENLFATIDDLAERIRALGMPAPRTVGALFSTDLMKDFEESANLETYLERLIAANDRLATELRETIKVAEKADDVKTADLLTDFIGTLEEAAWMYRATLGDQS